MTTETNCLAEAIDRIVAIEKLTLQSTYDGIDSVPYFYHVQETFPYITHRILEDIPSAEAQDYGTETYTIIGRVVLGHITSDSGAFAGVRDSEMYTMLLMLRNAFTRNTMLYVPVSTTYPSFNNEMAFIDPVGVSFRRMTGLTPLLSTGFPVQQVGFEYALLLPLTISTEQEY